MTLPSISRKLLQDSLRINLKAIKRRKSDNLKKIEDSFIRSLQTPATTKPATTRVVHFADDVSPEPTTVLEQLQAKFKVRVSPFNLPKGERIQVTSGDVDGEKRKAVKATFRRGLKGLTSYSDNAFRLGQEFGDLLRAEARNPHVSPRFILEKDVTLQPLPSVSEKSIKLYRAALEAFEKPENQALLKKLSDAGFETKLLQTGRFRIRRKQSGKSLLIKLAPRKKQDMAEFVDDSLRYAELLLEPSQYLSPKVVLKKKRLQNVVGKNGFQKYEDWNNLLGRDEIQDKIGNLKSKGFDVKITGAGRFKIKSSQSADASSGKSRSYLLKQNKTSTVDSFLDSALAFSEKMADKTDNVSPGLMFKNRFGFSRKVARDGIGKFENATSIFAANQERLDSLQSVGVDLKLRRNGRLRITRQENGRELFCKELRHKSGSLEQFIEDGLLQAERVASAPLPKKSLMSRLTLKNKRAKAHEQARIHAKTKAEEQARIQAELAEREAREVEEAMAASLAEHARVKAELDKQEALEVEKVRDAIAAEEQAREANSWSTFLFNLLRAPFGNS
jgi:hypothetical protein